MSCHLRLIVAGLLIPTLVSCSENSGKSGSEKSASKAKAARRDLLKTYEMVVNAASKPDLEQLEAGIQEIAKENGYEVTIAQMKDIASTHDDQFIRLAAMVTLKPHLKKEEFEALAKTALDDKRRELLNIHTKKPQK